MDLDDGQEDEGPLFAWLPPEDRLWRHPSEVDPPAGGATSPTSPTMRAAIGSRIWTVALLAGVVGALLASGVGMATGTFARHDTTVLEPVETPSQDTVSVVSSTADQGVGDWPAIADALAPSVVAVSVDSSSGPQIGSGVLYAASDRRSYVITADDLISSGGRVSVGFDDGETEPGTVVGADGVTGIAVLAVPGARRTFPMFGSVSEIEVAEPVLSVGARLANSAAVAPGAVSGLDQQLSSAGGPTMLDMLAVSGITVPETADGGALVDDAGAVIGIDTDLTSTDPDQQGTAYAVPIDVAEHVAQELLRGIKPTHPWLGIDDATDLSTSTAQQLGVSGGAQVGTVATGSPAAHVGLAANDIVISFDGEPVTSSGALIMLLSQCQPDRHTTLTYLNGGRRRTVDIVVGEQPTTDGD